MMTAEMAGVDEQVRTDIAAWFEMLQWCVREVDYEAGRGLFAPEVVSFGTHAEMVTGVDALQAGQWSNVWPAIADFTFDLAQLHLGAAGDVAWGAVPWTSTGFDEDGTPFPRPGRATVTLERRDGCWLATHTHFSLDPGTPARSYGA